MGNLLERIAADARARWVRVVQALNGFAIAIAGGALVVNQSYPDTFKQLVGALPGRLQLVVLFAFGTVVHYALHQAAKEPKP